MLTPLRTPRQIGRSRGPLRAGLAVRAAAASHLHHDPWTLKTPPPSPSTLWSSVYKAATAVDGISFRLAPGSITGLLGGNGAGKTTTIAMIMGLVTPTSGTVTVLGAQMPKERYRVLHRMNFESPYVDMPMRLTVRQNLSVFAQLYAVPDIGARIASLAAELDLTEFLDRPTGKLSSGQKTRVSLAKALLNRPEVLLLDEPTASLDPDTADWVRGRLERYRRASMAPPCCSPRTT